MHLFYDFKVSGEGACLETIAVGALEDLYGRGRVPAIRKKSINSILGWIPNVRNLSIPV